MCTVAVAVASCAASYVVPTVHSNIRPQLAAIRMGLDDDRSFDALVSEGKSSLAVAMLKKSNDAVDLKVPRVASLLDAACDASAEGTGEAADGAALMMQQASDPAATFQRQVQQQNDLLDCYNALSDAGALRGFASASSIDALPCPNPRIVLPDDQRRITSLPTSAFAPPRGNSNFDLIAGALSASLLFAASDFLQLDLRVLVGAGAGFLAADRLLLRGTVFEVLARALRPRYRKTVIQHEAGHFLVAYLLGMPLQACLLDPWSALKDGRFSGAAGTVFFDPALGDGMAKGTLRRDTLDRYSVVVLAGIAAEAMVNGQAEGGQADEQALVSLLSSLDGGRAWDLARIQNQARWGASQALLLLREHEEPYKALCAALERGASIGEAITVLEESMVATFGRNGELPAETRLRKARGAQMAAAEAAAAQQQQQQQQGVVSPAAAVKSAARSKEEIEAEQAAVAKRLEEVQKQLQELDRQ